MANRNYNNVHSKHYNTFEKKIYKPDNDYKDIDISTYMAYNIVPKEDLKEINGLEKISALKVYDFKFKNSENRMDGVLAHELAEVLPYAVHGEKDGKEMQGVDYSKLVPILIKAIQELKSENDTLKSILQRNNIS